MISNHLTPVQVAAAQQAKQSCQQQAALGSDRRVMPGVSKRKDLRMYCLHPQLFPQRRVAFHHHRHRQHLQRSACRCELQKSQVLPQEHYVNGKGVIDCQKDSSGYQCTEVLAAPSAEFRGLRFLGTTIGIRCTSGTLLFADPNGVMPAIFNSTLGPHIPPTSLPHQGI